MKVFISVLLPAISFGLSANQEIDFNSTNTISVDYLLDGELANNVDTTFDFKGSGTHFISENEGVILSGATSQDNQLVQFKLSNSNNGKLSYFVGKLMSNNSFGGTWYNNAGEQGDWQFKHIPKGLFQSCNEILQSGESTGDGVYTISPIGEDPISVYCDMTTDDGGWTLVGTYPKSEKGGKLRITEYSDIPETTPYNPTTAYLYQRSLAQFSDAREQVSCSTNNCADGKYAYADNLTELELEKIRYSWGAQDRVEHIPKYIDFPTCRSGYEASSEEYLGCARRGYIEKYGSPNNSIVGWSSATQDGFCWVARGTFNRNKLGSGLCTTNDARSEPNGTQWALLWMR
ncbi:fibrinogen-like YCDxxxxGGGW domain-containing protein [Pseudoalteromonas peptidolytica]|uniref:fibrinogen-like YCDxxxxGGGW domain-containing protein n=1 Tax=Pseudoalteromonas peptidolytica TaxID=61150 RepID=UPI00298D913A|nr:fibrinogen-like YCDxxxxGGGW domain-containing protein [Pseudoalteromonas peptidolytica]MDW7548555.1 fibrinogen-like YCDxxxxGGGW domain-containing protein [Pseudoalteromonas peptidolytica]